MTTNKNQKSQVLPLDYPINPATTSGVELADILNRTFNTMMSNNAGLDRPLNIERGGLWSQLDVAGDVILYMFDGVNDVEIGKLAGGTFTPPNSLPPDGVIVLSNFSIAEVGDKLFFSYRGTQIASLSSTGEFITKTDITAFGTP
jgi:hypothetical protein